MELLIGAVVTLLTQIIKKVTDRFGKETGGAIILLTAFLVSVGYTLGVDIADGFIDVTNIDYETILEVFASSVAIYEVVVKRVITPAIKKVTK